MATVEDWNTTLLDVLLPAREGGNQVSVLLSCDEVAVERAAMRLGVRGDPVDALARSLKVSYEITFERGVRGIVSDGRRWRRLPRPRPLPNFLSGLASTVVAASRMDRDENVSTNAYYARLCDFFAISKRDEWPGVAGFDALVTFFVDLQDWLAIEEEGRRGALVLREPPRNLSVVGVPIGQAPLRGRDRALLGRFFRSVRPALEAGHDPLRLLRRWGYASMLTARTREKLEDPELEEVMRAALRSAIAAWDGTVLGEDGWRQLDAELYLRINGPHVALRLVVAGLEEETAASGPDGPVMLPGVGQEFGVPVDWLENAALGPVSISVMHRRARVSVLQGATVLFEESDSGLRRVPVATSEPVAVLTCDSTLLADAHEDWIRGLPLPDGWQLALRVEPDALPASLRSTDPGDGDPQDVYLIGGLTLNLGAYLADHPPELLSELSEPARVEVNGVECGEALPGVPFDLRLAIGAVGVHHIVVGDTWEQVIELAERGPREGTDAYQWLPAGPAWAKASATAHSRDDDGPKVRGAMIIHGPEHPQWRPSFLTRHRDLVDVIFRDGTWTTCGPPPEDGWHRRMGIGADEPWELPRPREDISFVLLRGRRPQIACYADVDVEPSEVLLDLVAGYEHGEIVDHTPDGRGGIAWTRLLDRAIFEDPDAQA